MQDVVVDVGVDVFGVDEEAVDVEDTGADRWEGDSGGWHCWCGIWCGITHAGFSGVQQ